MALAVKLGIKLALMPSSRDDLKMSFFLLRKKKSGGVLDFYAPRAGAAMWQLLKSTGNSLGTDTECVDNYVLRARRQSGILGAHVSHNSRFARV